MNKSDLRLHNLMNYLSYAEVKNLVHRLGHLRETEGIRSIALLSEETGEGKTFLALVLAAGLANRGPEGDA